ncbi:hypothetical protein ACS0TY_011247 [Phlomoides rotata]
MTSILVSHPPSKFPAAGDTFSLPHKGSDFRILCFPHSNSDRTRSSTGPTRRRIKDSWAIFSGKLDDGVKGDDNSEDDFNQEDSKKGGIGPSNSDLLRESLEKIVGVDDSGFSGIDLATLIRNKYGRSYDVQLIKKEFMGKNLLALNVMWKYMEQVSCVLEILSID